MTIYVIEIPHQMPVRAWVAEHKQDFIRRVNASRNEAAVDIEEAVDIIAGDLHSAMIFAGEKEAREALADEAQWNCHQGIAARAALRDLLD